MQLVDVLGEIDLWGWGVDILDLQGLKRFGEGSGIVTHRWHGFLSGGAVSQCVQR